MANLKRRKTTKKLKRRAPARKTTTRKAYNKGVKKNTAKMLQPIAEGRKLTFTNTTSPRFLGPTIDNENWYAIIPETWTQMYRENFLDTLPNQPASMGFTGKTLFSRFLNQQIKIKFDTINHYTHPVSVQVVYGWCKIPYVTPLQSTGSDSASNPNGVLIAHNRQQLIETALSKMYNVMFPVTDPKQFKLMYNRQFQVRGDTVEGLDFTNPASPTQLIQTVRKDLDYNITWKPNTKYHMRAATQGDGSNGQSPPGNDLSPDDGFPNYRTAAINATSAYWTPSSKNNGDLWTPFFAMRVKNAVQYGRAPGGETSLSAYPYLFQQNKHYFYDL